MSALVIVGSLIFAIGALVLAWRGVDHLPPQELVPATDAPAATGEEPKRRGWWSRA